jgi:hypothetical protein
MNGMSMEEMLCLNNEAEIIVVRPFFGNQSDSYSGVLSVHADESSIIYQFILPGRATIFTIDDVKKVEQSPSTQKYMVYLKGPEDYK